MEAILLYLKKLQTIIVDRRAFAALLTLLVALGLVNLTADEVGALDQQVVDLIKLLANLLAPLLAGGFLVNSWGTREPSGLKRDETAAVDELREELAMLKKSYHETLLSALRDAGVSLADDE